VIRDFSLPKELLEMISAGEVTASRREILENSAEIILGDAREKFQEVGLSDITSDFLMGDPASTIDDYAEQNGVDLIVIGYRGLGTHGKMLGSVARKLTNLSAVSCLIVR
jgi:nucleotide-binding universal stress UspA family protein